MVVVLVKTGALPEAWQHHDMENVALGLQVSANDNIQFLPLAFSSIGIRLLCTLTHTPYGL